MANKFHQYQHNEQSPLTEHLSEREVTSPSNLKVARTLRSNLFEQISACRIVLIYNIFIAVIIFFWSFQ